MKLPPALAAIVEKHASEIDGRRNALTSVEPIGGGCINQAARLHFTSGLTAFLKWNRSAPRNMFQREAEGLTALGATKTLRVPEVLLWGDLSGEGLVPGFLLLEDIAASDHKPNPRTRDFDDLLGKGLAAMHALPAPYFGFSHDNYIGSTPQLNQPMETWADFFRERRLLPIIERLRETGKISDDVAEWASRCSEKATEHLRQVSEGPSLVHGDLWGGNVMSDGDGRPALIDPACYYGHREVDLAMTELFGGFSAKFRAAYEAAYPLENGYALRRDIYNLYHVLNHAHLFGGGYWSQAKSILNRFDD